MKKKLTKELTELLNRANSGDEHAFTDFVEKVEPDMKDYCRRAFNGKFIDMTDDIVNASLNRFHDNLKGMRELHKAKHWLQVAIKREGIDENRIEIRRPHISQYNNEGNDILASIIDDSEDSDPEAVAIREEEKKQKAEMVNSTLKKLKHDYRTVLECRFEKDMSVKATAEYMGLSEGSIKRLTSEAKNAFIDACPVQLIPHEEMCLYTTITKNTLCDSERVLFLSMSAA